VDADPPRRHFDLVAYLKLFRFPLVFTAVADSAAGCLLGSVWPHRTPGAEVLDRGALGFIAASSAGLYLFGMALNDLADVEKDRVSAPGRVLPSGRLSLGQAKGAALGMLVLSLCALYPAGSTAIVQRVGVWCGVAVSIVAYNLFLKIPPVMGLVRCLNLLLGFSTSVGWSDAWNGHPGSLVALGIPGFVYVTSLTYVSTLEDADHGRGRVALGAGGMMAAALLASIILPLWPGGRDSSGVPVQAPEALMTPALLFSGALAAWVARRAWQAGDRKGIMLLVRDGVGGIIFLDAALLASRLGGFPAWGVAILVIPAAGCVWVFKKLA
jgi:4-hydroxybenzoate polyprenyltransferase